MTSLLPKKPKVLVVANALDAIPTAARQRYMAEIYDPYTELASYGFSVSDLDLRNYFGGAAGLHDRLLDADFVWVLGGNSFVLRRAMALSGFDAEVIRSLNSDDLMYGGFSAGAVVVPPSLKGIDLMDDPGVVPDGYTAAVVWSGLGLIDFSIVPHFRSDHPETQVAELAADYFTEHGIPFKTLADGDVIVKSGNTIEILCDG